jgi:hypothetical protein
MKKIKENIKMLEEMENTLKRRALPNVLTDCSSIDERLISRRTEEFQPKQLIKIGKKYGTITAVYTDYCVVRWKDATVTSEKKTRLKKI